MTKATYSNRARIEKRLAGRHAAEQRFIWYGRIAIAIALLMLVILLGSMLVPSINGFRQTQIALDLSVSSDVTDVRTLKRKATRMVKDTLLEMFPVSERNDRRQVFELIASSPAISVAKAWEEQGRPHDKSFTVWVPASDKVDQLIKGRVDTSTPESERMVKDQQLGWVESLQKQGRVQTVFNTQFFTGGDSRDPVRAGFWGSIVGSVLTMAICLLVSFPIGVMSAVYLEEFARKNWLTDVIEVNINNLAAVPSIVFGLLGLSVYLNVMELPRSAPLVGGLTLALMTLPVIIITTRVSLQAVPDSIRMAALGLGASKLQSVMHHVLPLAMPGIMTGTILGMARAIGETAPLLMIGMVAFIVDIPGSFTESATVMPVQIYLWASSAELGFADKTAAGIVVLVTMLLLMNAMAIYLRKRYERRW